jgi:hypothetical protein
METVKIKTAINTGKKYQDKDIVEVVLEDGREGSCFDIAIIASIGKEISLDVKEGKEYQGKKKFYFNIPKEGSKGKFPMKDYTFEKKRAALELAVSLVASDKIKIDLLVETRDKFYEYLKS